MNRQDFSIWYESAKKVNVVTDPLFVCAGYFWIDLTKPQIKKMYDLMLSQGAVEDRGGIFLSNGLQILKPGDRS